MAVYRETAIVLVEIVNLAYFQMGRDYICTLHVWNTPSYWSYTEMTHVTMNSFIIT